MHWVSVDWIVVDRVVVDRVLVDRVVVDRVVVDRLPVRPPAPDCRPSKSFQLAVGLHNCRLNRIPLLPPWVDKVASLVEDRVVDKVVVDKVVVDKPLAA